jgi:branched-chain amino acid transport system substrate-binding protein
MSRGAELAVRDRPNVQGFEIELLVGDTKGEPGLGLAVAKAFAADPRFVAVAGHTFSGSCEAAMPVYDRAGIVMVSPSANDPDLTKQGSPVFNRVAFTDEMQGEFAAKYIYETLGVRRMAIVHDGSAYGQGLAELTASSFEELGGTVVAQEGITPGEMDYSAPLAAIADEEPELIYYGGYDSDAAVLATQMAGAGLEDVIFFGCDSTYGADYIDLAGAAAEGTFSTWVPIPESAAFEQFKADYEAAYGDEQGRLSPFGPHAYDAMVALIEAIEEVAVERGSSLIIPRKALADAVRATSNHQGLTGTITCSEVGECAAQSVLFVEVKDGEWVPGPGQ